MVGHSLTAGESAPTLVVAFAIALLHVLSFYGYGRLSSRLLVNVAEDAVLVIIPAVGVGVTTLLLLILGQIHLLYRGVVLALFGVGAALAIGWAPLRRAAWTSPAVLRRAWQCYPLWTGLFGVVVGFLLVSCTAPPRAYDELAYHWAAPIFWAHHHGWVRFPYRFVNGAALAEIGYTAEAVFDVSTGAHLLHLWFAALLCMALAVIARRRGVPRMWAVLAVFASPVVLLEASIAYSDVMFAALLACGLCALTTIDNRHRFWIAGLVLALAVSIKVLALIALPGFVAVAATWGSDEGWGIVAGRGSQIRQAAVISIQLVLPVVFVAAIWAIHSLITIHQLFPSNGYSIATVAQNPEAAGRIPTVVDVVLMPVLWITVTVLGNHQPYGNRIGIMVLLALPTAILLWRVTSPPSRRMALSLMVPAMLYLVFDVVVARTRFNIYAWLILPLGALVPVAERAMRSARFARWANLALTLCLVESMADALRQLYFP